MENTEKAHKSNMIKTFLKVILVFSIFSLGFFSAISFNAYQSDSLEHPLSYFSGSEAKAPSNSIQENQILVYKDKVVIEVPGASLSAYASTGSMLPLFDKGANGIRIAPQSPDEINVGDIITFERDSNLIVHRVVEKGQDDEGIYFVTKGDNNLYTDGKVYFQDVRYKTIAILY